MKNLLFLILSIILFSCGDNTERVESGDSSKHKNITEPETLIYIYYPDGEVDTCEAYDVWQSEVRVWWNNMEGKRMSTTLPNTTVDL